MKISYENEQSPVKLAPKVGRFYRCAGDACNRTIFLCVKIDDKYHLISLVNSNHWHTGCNKLHELITNGLEELGVDEIVLK